MCGKPCEHGGDINTDTGICSICGAVVSVAIYTSADGNLSSYLDADELHSLLNEYNGSGTIKLFKDYSKPSAQYDLYGELTIDVNGRQFNIRSITPCKNGKLTIKFFIKIMILAAFVILQCLPGNIKKIA
jgi:trimeric autotransporter adhesin